MPTMRMRLKDGYFCCEERLRASNKSERNHLHSIVQAVDLYRVFDSSLESVQKRAALTTE